MASTVQAGECYWAFAFLPLPQAHSEKTHHGRGKSIP
jgi:hypothetical protein